MQKSPSVLLLGATGRIGSALVRAIKLETPNIRLTALVRSTGCVRALSGTTLPDAVVKCLQPFRSWYQRRPW